jgi:hypothetical protein
MPARASGSQRQDDLVGIERRRACVIVFQLRSAERGSVVLGEEGRDDLVVGDLGLLDRVRPDVGKLAGAHVQKGDLDELALPIEADHVAVDVVDRDDALLLAHLFDGAELIAVHGGQLEAHLARRRPSSSRRARATARRAAPRGTWRPRRPARRTRRGRPARRTARGSA